jgi:prepilin signal peptidase PulO-like enzyme (type II secretory pathway)
MNPLLAQILAGVAIGALLAFPVRLLTTFLLRQRGLEGQMPRRYFWILLACLAVVGGVIGWRTGFTLRGVYLILLLFVAACGFYIDARNRIIPNELVLAILVLAAAFGLTGQIPFQIGSSLLGLTACFVLFFLPSVFGRSIGAGDVKLAAAMGFALGLTGSLYAIAGMGLLVLGYVLLSSNLRVSERLKQTIPMGPFLTVALVAVSVL